jgi:hypothetical protein
MDLVSSAWNSFLSGRINYFSMYKQRNYQFISLLMIIFGDLPCTPNIGSTDCFGYEHLQTFQMDFFEL